MQSVTEELSAPEWYNEYNRPPRNRIARNLIIALILAVVGISIMAVMTIGRVVHDCTLDYTVQTGQTAAWDVASYMKTHIGIPGDIRDLSDQVFNQDPSPGAGDHVVVRYQTPGPCRG